MSDLKKVNDEILEDVSGGNGEYGYADTWMYGTVHDVVDYGPGSCLSLRNAPDGDVMYNADGTPMGWQNGESIYVSASSRIGNWMKAQYGSVIGWVNANYVWY